MKRSEPYPAVNERTPGRPDRRANHTSVLFGISLMVCYALLLSGCFGRGEEATVDLNFTQMIPSDWTPVGDFQEINIDGDPLQEYLLFYTYDNGQAGAVIYDPQLEGESLGLSPAPAGENPPSSLLVPYRILPSYWSNSGQGMSTAPDGGVGPGSSPPRLLMGQGFIAPPGTAAEIGVSVKQRPANQAQPSEQAQAAPVAEPTVTASATPSSAATADELLLQSGANYMTFVWWRSSQAGYGVAQLFAPGGLTDIQVANGAAGEGTVEAAVGLYPYNDRSLLCRRVDFTRTLAATTPAGAYRPDIEFKPTDQGIVFCGTAPTYPFYPEGVVLAYLKDPSGHASLATEGFDKQMQVLAPDFSTSIVDDLQTVASLPVLETYRIDGSRPVITTVCADLIRGAEIRRLLFTLQHMAPTLNATDTSTSDRMVITSAENVTDKSQTSNCEQLLTQTPSGGP